MPTPRQIRRQTATLAGAAVPTKRSIRRQYGEAQRDVTGFTQALVSQLRGSARSGDKAYQDIVDQQRAIDAQLGQTLGGIDPGAQAAVAARAGTALSGLVARRASNAELLGQMPGVAASRGALQHQTLTTGMLDAMRQRNDAYRSAYAQAYQQVQSNAFNQAMGIQQLGLSRADLRERSREFDINAAIQQQGQRIQQGQFNRTEDRLWKEFVLEQQRLRDAAKSPGSKKAKGFLAGMTPTQIRSIKQDLIEGAQTGAKNRATPEKSVETIMLSAQVPRRLAEWAVASVYSSFKNAPKGSSGQQAYQAYLKWWARLHRPANKQSGGGRSSAKR